MNAAVCKNSDNRAVILAKVPEECISDLNNCLLKYKQEIESPDVRILFGINNSPEDLSEGFTFCVIVRLVGTSSQLVFATAVQRIGVICKGQTNNDVFSASFSLDLSTPFSPLPTSTGRSDPEILPKFDEGECIHHLVIWKYKNDTPPEIVTENEIAYRKLDIAHKCLQNIEIVFFNIKLPSDSVEDSVVCILYSTFADERSRDEFLQDSERKIFKRERVQPHLMEDAATIVVDFVAIGLSDESVINDRKSNTELPSTFWIFILLLLFNYCIYLNSLKNEFAFDDYLGIVTNRDMTPQVPFQDILRHDLWGKHLLKIDSHRSFRPLLTLIFKLFCHTFGIEPFPIRVFSIFAHSVASFLVYVLGNSLTNNKELSLVGSFLFAAHPVHVEAVACVINMAEPICAVLYITAILIYIRSISSAVLPFLERFFYLIIWLSIVIVSCLVKETGITVVGVVWASTALSILSTFSANMWSFQPTVSSILSRGHISFVIAGVFALGWYIVLRKLIVTVDAVEYFQAAFVDLKTFKQKVYDLYLLLSSPNNAIYLDNSELIRKAENPFTFLKGQERYLSYMYLHFRYFYLLFFPMLLCAEYAFNCIPSVPNLLDIRNFYSLSVYIVFFVTVANCLISVLNRPKRIMNRSNDKNLNLYFASDSEYILICIALIVVPFFPMSGIVRLGTLLAERLLYLPSIGYCMLLAWFFKFISSGSSVGFRLISVVAIALYSFRVILRNPAWKDDRTLHFETLKACPNSAKVNMQIANKYFQTGKETGNEKYFARAKFHVQRAKNIDPQFCDVGYLEAVLATTENNATAAVDYAVENLKCVFTSKDSLQLLMQIWDLQVSAAPQSVVLHEYIGDKCAQGGLFSAAIKKYVLATKLSMEQGHIEKALSINRKAIHHFEMQASNNSAEDGDIYRHLKCALDSSSGQLRHTINLSFPNGNKKIKGFSSLISKTEKYLFNAIKPHCSYIDGENGDVAIDSLIAVHTLSGIYETIEKEKSEIDTLDFMESYLKMCVSAQLSLDASIGILKSRNFRSNSAPIKTVKEYYQVIYTNAQLLRYSVAQLYFTAGNYSASDRLYSDLYRNFDHLRSLDFGVERVEIPNLLCSSYFWAAHAKAGKIGFTSNKIEILGSISLLKIGLKCSDSSVDESMKFGARKNLKELTRLLDQLNSQNNIQDE